LVSALSIVRLSVRIHLHLLVVLSGWRSRGLFTAHGVIWLCLLLWERIQWRIKTVFALGRMLQHLLFLLACIHYSPNCVFAGVSFLGTVLGANPCVRFFVILFFSGFLKVGLFFGVFFCLLWVCFTLSLTPCSCSREYMHILLACSRTGSKWLL